MELNNEFEVGVAVAEAWDVLTDVERIAPCLPGAELREVEGDEYRGVVKVKVGPISAEYRGAARFVEKDEASHRAVLRAEGREARGQGNANATITASLRPSGDGTKVSVTTDLQITGKVAQFGRGVLADVSNKLLGQFVDNLETTVLSGESTGSETKKTSPGKPRRKPRSTQRGKASAEDADKASEDADEATDNANEKAVRADEEAVHAHEAAQDADEAARGSTSRRDEASADGAVRQVMSRPAEPVDLVQVAGAPVARRVLPVLGGALLALVALALLRRLFGSSSR